MLSAISFVTIAPAPIIAFSPMVMPGKIVAFAPMLAPFLIIVLENSSGYCLDLGYLSLQKVTLGPIKTLSSIVIPSQI